jgi:hypothetical protein
MARVNSTTKETGNNFNVANGTGAAVRAGINDIFTALRTINSASGDPSGTGNVVQFQPHIDSSTNLLKICTAVSSGTGTFTTIGDITQANLGLVNAATPTMTGDVTMSSTGFLRVPLGTDAQQPGQSGQPAAAIGQLRYNSTQNRFEGYKNTGWGEIGGGAGATGGGTDQVFVETGQNVTEDYTLSAGKNAMTVSPTIANNKTITVPNNAILVIL